MIIGSNILRYGILSSTNSEAVSLIKSSEPDEGTVICCDYQSAGKGQAGSRWESEKGMNLLFSLILYPASVMPEEQFLISMAVSLGVCDFLDRHCTGTMIKWPNDIYYNNRKIAGILIQNSVLGQVIENTVAGIGININQDRFPPFHPEAISLKMITAKQSDLSICLDQVLADLDRRYRQLLYADREQLKNEYLPRLYRYHEWHYYKHGGSVFKGMISDVMASGQIIIDDDSGTKRKFSFKEFEYSP